MQGVKYWLAEATERGVLLAPSLLGANPLEIAGDLERLEGKYDWLHLDIMDGHFVRNLSFGPGVAVALRKRYPEAFIDAHLMIDRTEVLLPAFLQAGMSLVTLHAEAEMALLYATLSSIRSAGVLSGIAIAPATGVERIVPLLEVVDMVLVMSVTPGFGGQSFIPSALEKTRELVRLRAVRGLDYLIQMDGGINADNIGAVVAAGCDVVVAGSAVFNSPDPAMFLDTLHSNAKNARKR